MRLLFLWIDIVKTAIHIILYAKLPIKHIKKSNDGNRVMFYVELGDYVFPRDWTRVQDDILRLRDIPIKATGTNSKDDGRYITVNENNILGVMIEDTYFTGASGWNEAVKTLNEKRAFLATGSEDLDTIDKNDLANRTPFFFRIEYQKNEYLGDSYKNIAPKNKATEKGWESYFYYSSINKCRVKIYFYFPLWKEDRSAEVKLQIKNENTGNVLNNSSIVFKDNTDDPDEQRGDRFVQFLVPDSECEIVFEILSFTTASILTFN